MYGYNQRAISNVPARNSIPETLTFYLPALQNGTETLSTEPLPWFSDTDHTRTYKASRFATIEWRCEELQEFRRLGFRRIERMFQPDVSFELCDQVALVGDWIFGRGWTIEGLVTDRAVGSESRVFFPMPEY